MRLYGCDDTWHARIRSMAQPKRHRLWERRGAKGWNRAAFRKRARQYGKWVIKDGVFNSEYHYVEVRGLDIAYFDLPGEDPGILRHAGSDPTLMRWLTRRKGSAPSAAQWAAPVLQQRVLTPVYGSGLSGYFLAGVASKSAAGKGDEYISDDEILNTLVRRLRKIEVESMSPLPGARAYHKMEAYAEIAKIEDQIVRAMGIPKEYIKPPWVERAETPSNIFPVPGRIEFRHATLDDVRARFKKGFKK